MPLCTEGFMGAWGRGGDVSEDDQDSPVIIGSSAQAAANKSVGEYFSDKAAIEARHMAICHLAALGHKAKFIASSLDMNPSSVSSILNTPEAKEMVKGLQTKMYMTDPTAMFRAMAPRAARTVDRIMRDTSVKPNTRLAAASEILDRAYGKPTQEVKHEGSLLKDLFQRLDDEAKGASSAYLREPPIEAEYTEVGASQVPAAEGADSCSGGGVPADTPSVSVGEAQAVAGVEPGHGDDKKTGPVGEAKVSGEDIDKWVEKL